MLQSYGLVRSNSGKDFELATKLWQTLGEHIPLCILKEVLSAIMKLPFDPTVDKELDFAKLHETFKLFYLNKMSAKKQKVVTEVYSYRPKLSEMSMKIARRQRNYDLKEQRSKHEATIMETARKVLTESTKECTFKPRINRSKSVNSKGSAVENR